MVKVKFTLKNGKTMIRTFPKTDTLRHIKAIASSINPSIKKVEYYRKKK